MNALFKSFVAGAALAVLSACAPKEFRAVSIDTSRIQESQRFIGGMLQERIQERVSPAGNAGTLKVSYLIDPAIEGEKAIVKVGKGTAEISAGRTRGLIFGTGVLLREINYGPESFSLKPGEYVFAPANSYRACYMARHFNTWYQWASAEEMLRYIDDMFLWGINTLNTQVAMATVNYSYSTQEERDMFDKTTEAIFRRVKECDMDFRTGGGGNTYHNFPPEFAATPLNPKRGDDTWNVCPSKPGALDFLLEKRREKLETFKAKGYDFTAFGYFPYDEGGCQCEECAPWGGNGYVKTIEAMRRLNEEYYPGATHSVSTWFFDDKDYESFFKYLETQDWIKYIEIDSHTDFPRYPLEHKIPGNVRVTTFPEISMWGRCPWGGYGATALPARFERLFRQVENIVDGFRLYSEGLYEDINKVVITGLYTDPSRNSDDMLEQYARYELPGADTADFKKFISLLETTHLTGNSDGERRKDFNFLVFLRDADPKLLDERQAEAAEALALAEKIESQIIPAMRGCWRWRQLILRARIDNEIFSSRTLHTPVADECYSELVKLYHAEYQVERLFKLRKDGYTAPPYIPEVQMPAYEESHIYDQKESNDKV